MTESRGFHSVDFFRRVRDKHSEVLSTMDSEEIIRFFQSASTPNNGATSDRVLAGRRSSADQPARGGVR